MNERKLCFEDAQNQWESGQKLHYMQVNLKVSMPQNDGKWYPEKIDSPHQSS